MSDATPIETFFCNTFYGVSGTWRIDTNEEQRVLDADSTQLLTQLRKGIRTLDISQGGYQDLQCHVLTSLFIFPRNGRVTLTPDATRHSSAT
jgi:hypothetical protein